MIPPLDNACGIRRLRPCAAGPTCLRRQAEPVCGRRPSVCRLADRSIRGPGRLGGRLLFVFERRLAVDRVAEGFLFNAAAASNTIAAVVVGCMPANNVWPRIANSKSRQCGFAIHNMRLSIWSANGRCHSPTVDLRPVIYGRAACTAGLVFLCSSCAASAA